MQKLIFARINYCAPYLRAEFLVLNTAHFCACAQYSVRAKSSTNKVDMLFHHTEGKMFGILSFWYFTAILRPKFEPRGLNWPEFALKMTVKYLKPKILKILKSLRILRFGCQAPPTTTTSHPLQLGTDLVDLRFILRSTH